MEAGWVSGHCHVGNIYMPVGVSTPVLQLAATRFNEWRGCTVPRTSKAGVDNVTSNHHTV